MTPSRWFALIAAVPQSARDWRSFGPFSAFIVALFTEMYGFPMTIYLLSGWFTHFPGVDFLTPSIGGIGRAELRKHLAFAVAHAADRCDVPDPRVDVCTACAV